MIDTVALREKVLDLAIRGKLVPQDPNDEPASVLLERIRAQKQQMVKDGKLKAKDIKDDSVIFVGEDNLHYEKFADGTVKCIEDEIPFELPSGWGWTRISNIASVKGGKRVPKGMTFSTEPTHHAYVRVTDMKNHTVNLSDLKYIDETVFAEIKNYTIAKNDLYITIAGTIGAVGEFPDELDGMNLTENAVKVSAIGINKSFLCFIMQTEFVQKQFKHKTYQVAMPKLGLERILTTLIPVCGIVTQQKICDAIQNSTKYIDIIGENYSGLSETIAIIKSKILDLAIRGKLVPQNPDDEPASALFERIRAEKEELIKQGKIKRDKKESVIFKGEDNSYYEKIGEKVICIDDELPFDVPASWSWTRFGNIVLNYDSQRRPITKHNRVNDLGLYDYYGATGAIDKVDSYIFDGEYLMIGEDGGNFFTQRDNSFIASGRFWANNHVHIVQPVVCDIWYLKHFLDSCDLALMGLITGIGVPKLNQENMNKIIVPIPPIEEQERIAFKVKEIYSVLSNVEKSLS